MKHQLMCFLTVVLAPAIGASAVAADDAKSADDGYPVDGLTCIEMRQMLEQVRTNLPPTIRIAFVWAKKGKQAVIRTLLQDSKGKDRVEDLRLRLAAVSVGASPIWQIVERTKPESLFHSGGIPPADVVEMLRAFPVGPTILSIAAGSDTRVTVMTGTVSGPLAGGGRMFTYEKKDAKWEKTAESDWVS